MAKSKTRGGAKAHRKRVQARNQKLRGERNAMQKLWNDQILAQMEEIRKQQEAEQGTVSIDASSPELPNSDENTPLEIKL
jgi:hypothetical protein